MKCEYCENEIENPRETSCPFCGAPLISVESLPKIDNGDTAVFCDNNLSPNVVCKECGRPTNRQVFLRTLTCSSCGSHEAFTDVSSDFEALDIRKVCGMMLVRCTGCKCDTELSHVLKTRRCQWCETELIPQSKQSIKEAGLATGENTDSPQVTRIKVFIAALRESDIFKEIDVSDYGFVADAGEIVYDVIDDLTLNETRSIRRSHTEKTGSSSYDYEGNSESKTHYEFQVVTKGNLFLTNRRIVFTGGQQVRNIKFGDIVTFESDWKPNGGAIQISSSKRMKAMRFTDANVLRFTLIYNAIRSEKFRDLIENGSEEELISKFIEVGLFYGPPVVLHSDEMPSTPVVQTNEKGDSAGCALGVIIFAILVFVIFLLSQS